MPNELHVYLVRARDLEAMDSGLLGKASSDPIVVLDVMGTSHKSTQKKKELNSRLVGELLVARGRGRRGHTKSVRSRTGMIA